MGESDLDAVRRIVQKERAMIERTNNDVDQEYEESCCVNTYKPIRK